MSNEETRRKQGGSSGQSRSSTKKKPAAKTAARKNGDTRKNAWLKYNATQKKEIFDYCEGYKQFISDCKTERECVDEVVRQAKKQGFKDLADYKTLKAGDKVIVTNMNKDV